MHIAKLANDSVVHPCIGDGEKRPTIVRLFIVKLARELNAGEKLPCTSVNNGIVQVVTAFNVGLKAP